MDDVAVYSLAALKRWALLAIATSAAASRKGNSGNPRCFIGVLALLILSACAPIEQRCEDLQRQTLILPLAHDEVSGELDSIRNTVAYGHLSAEEKVHAAKAFLAALQNPSGLDKKPSDSVLSDVVPPRPSELAWYAEHCFNGHAR